LGNGWDRPASSSGSWQSQLLVFGPPAPPARRPDATAPVIPTVCQGEAERSDRPVAAPKQTDRRRILGTWTSLSRWDGRMPPDSAQNGDLLPLDEIEIDVRAEAGLVEGMHQSVPVDLDILGEAVLLCRRREQDLEKLAVADRHGDVKVGDVVQRVAAM